MIPYPLDGDPVVLDNMPSLPQGNISIFSGPHGQCGIQVPHSHEGQRIIFEDAGQFWNWFTQETAGVAARAVADAMQNWAEGPAGQHLPERQ